MSELVNLSEATVIKEGNAFCLARRDGSMPSQTGHPLGLYRNDCRHLRTYELRVNDQRPRLLIASAAAGTAALFEMTNPDLELESGALLPLQSLRIRLERRMLEGGMVDRISVHSHARQRAELKLDLKLDADFKPMLEVRGLLGRGRRSVRRQAAGSVLALSAVGLDGRERSTTIESSTAVARDDGLVIALDLDPGEEKTVEITFSLAEGESRAGRPAIDGEETDRGWVTRAGAQADAWLAERVQVDADDELIDRVLRRSLLDLRLLASEIDGQAYYAAGVPWYATLFGRDSIITALQMLAFDRGMAEQTLRILAGRLGTELDDERDEEPGKVLHELRSGEVATAGLTPLARYYGTVDATPLFLCLLCDCTDWTGSLELFRALRPQVEQAVAWIDRYGDLDQDGLLEYRTRSAGGLVNQGWKDSWDGVVDEEGAPLEAPIALVEAQGYTLRAKQHLARLFELEGDHERAAKLREDAAALGSAIERFWLADRGFYAMALDGEKRPSRALASNQGHLLWALAVPPERAEAIRTALMGGAAYSGWGVRTLGGEEPAFNPVGYHTGTVWPHDNALIALGFRKYGLDDAFLRIFEDLLDAAASLGDYRLPELFAGFSRTDYEDPVPYPVACSPQAWAAGTLPALLTAGLGLVPDALNRILRIRRPSLPRQLGSLTMSGLRVGDARVDLVFERVSQRAESVALTDVRIDGDLEVVLEVSDSIHDHARAPQLDDVKAAR